MAERWFIMALTKRIQGLRGFRVHGKEDILEVF